MFGWKFSSQIAESVANPRNSYAVHLAEAIQHVAFDEVLEREKSPLAVHWSKKVNAWPHPVMESGIRDVKVPHRFLKTVVRDLKRVESISPHFAPRSAVRGTGVLQKLSLFFWKPSIQKSRQF